ncbi:flavodoxin family protein [Clostridium sp. Marseille-P2415]|uniref:flavodoxin family protein n=1 Tax=Clostridium sp. Marseille-P2415 TaxID=1805471 RepID=UPI0009883E18|nr:NAD(P)H-dependent oxidoreductase [Clostridium sp. Marseille-P2415]
MKTLVIYYSYTGNTKKIAEQTAKKENADICEVVEKNRPGTVKAFTAGSFHAMRGMKSEVEPITADLSSYDRLIVMAPVWAGNPAPAMNNVFDALPSGKEVEVIMVSASGKSSCKDRLEQLIGSRGSRLSGFTDLSSKQ